jgi:transcriptional regulator with XRE-family HTH domain
MIDSGEIDEPVPHGQFIGLTELVHDLKERRTRLKLSLTDVADRSGLTRAAVSRLENGWNANPTLETLYRYALALNANIRLVAEDLVDDEELRGDDD